MSLHFLDFAVIAAFLTLVVGVSLYKSRKEKDSEDYFLAGRGLIWPLIGFSIVAANISTEQFVGMAGQSAGGVGLAVSNWQLTGSVGIVIVAFFFLPRFLRAGIYTMPEYLEYRYNALARALMALATMIIYVTVTTTTVLYSGALAMNTIFGMDLGKAVWLIGGIAAIYTVWGGLKAVAWADLIQGSTLMVGGFLTMLLGFHAIGVVNFFEHNADKLHMILPANHPDLPWTGLVMGIWIPIFYYCGLNQFIVQRTLAAKDLRNGQLGIVFAAAMWVLVPFFIVFPGLMAQQLYGAEIAKPDQAYPMLIRHLMPAGLRGFIFAALAGAVISSLASMLNSASTIFTMDLYKRHLRPEASQTNLVLVGRTATLVFVVAACLMAPYLANERFRGVFNFIQEFQGYISPGILVAFVFGFLVPRAPGIAGVLSIVGNVPIYYLLHLPAVQTKLLKIMPFLAAEVVKDNVTTIEIAYINQMALTALSLIVLMAVVTIVAPLREPKVLPVKQDIDTRPDPIALGAGLAVIALVGVFYWIFW